MTELPLSWIVGLSEVDSLTVYVPVALVPVSARVVLSVSVVVRLKAPVMLLPVSVQVRDSVSVSSAVVETESPSP